MLMKGRCDHRSCNCNFRLGHFRVPFASVSKRVSVRNLSYENVSPFRWKSYLISYQRFCTWTRFEREAKGNSEMAYCVRRGNGFESRGSRENLFLRANSQLLQLRLQLRWSHLRFICISAVHIISVLCLIFKSFFSQIMKIPLKSNVSACHMTDYPRSVTMLHGARKSLVLPGLLWLCLVPFLHFLNIATSLSLDSKFFSSLSLFHWR